MINPNLGHLDFWSLLLKEDAPEGDSTVNALNIPVSTKTAKIYAKQDLSLSGTEIIFKSLPKNLEVQVEPHFKDGVRIKKGETIASFKGPWPSLLLVERPMLNWIGHFSGIASLTWQFTQKVKHTKCKILDTRKTMPLYRKFEKQAVLHGGGGNHRQDLSDAMMLKENHLSLFDFDFKTAINLCLEKYPNKHLTVETRSPADVKQVLETKAHRIMLDNFSNEQTKEAVDFIDGATEVEASGNMSLERVAAVADLGVDFISVGALTHSAAQADISMLMDFKQ